MDADTRSLPSGYNRTSLAVLMKSRIRSGIAAISEGERASWSCDFRAAPAPGSVRV